MAMSPAYALAHVFLPNHTKLKGAATLISAIERKEKAFFDIVWSQAFVTHDPQIHAELREPYRIGVISLPPPKEMGEAYLAGWLVKRNDPAFWRYYTLEHDYVLARRENRTVLAERDGQKHSKHGDGPPVTGNFAVDARAFIDCFMELHVPTKVSRK
ncbi:MAG TPA: hypothetical protein VFQ53_43200 [Kofleriaceae bacterium]|nr:hypothetical protein [Kofleriaceae bacterium]